MSQADETYYNILGVPRDASPEDITSSYRKLAKVLHPDVCNSPDAEELFKAVNEAYQTLRDPKKREEYNASLVTAHPSPYGGYHEGSRKYRDPRTWYYAYTPHTGRTYTRPEDVRRPVPKSVIPRVGQVLLFYLTLFMAIAIITQLFLMPWINGMNAADARNSLQEGNRWMEEDEFQKAIESYQTATTRLPSFSEAWRAKGLAEVKKADELSELHRGEADKYYRDAIRSFSRINEELQEDASVKKGLARAFIRTGDANRALSLLTSIPSGSADPEVNSLIQEANTRMNTGSSGL